jgi:hypothetical protein
MRILGCSNLGPGASAVQDLIRLGAPACRLECLAIGGIVIDVRPGGPDGAQLAVGVWLNFSPGRGRSWGRDDLGCPVAP